MALSHPLLIFTLLLPSSAPSSPNNAVSASLSPPPPPPAPASPVNPFTAKAAFIRYWNRKVPNNRPHPAFFLAKLSPLSAPDAATFSSLAAAGKLRSRLPAFCAAASLLCPSAAAAPTWSSSGRPAATVSMEAAAASQPFKNYENGNFTNYGTIGGGGADEFTAYSMDENVPVDTFLRYARDSVGRNDSFASYEAGGNLVTTNFTSYASRATGGAGEFSAYAFNTNIPALTFSNYDAGGNGRRRGFSSYTQDSNTGQEDFSGYGKNGNDVGETFKSYGNNTNTIPFGFTNYGQTANGATDTFTSYGENGNGPTNTFRSYGAGGNSGADEFKTYRAEANTGDDSFVSYAKGANGGGAEFENYGKSFNQGSDSFKGYGEGTNPNHRIGFKRYSGENTTFKTYSTIGIEFKEYHNMSKTEVSKAAAPVSVHQNLKWLPEPGKFFREAELVAGNQMAMPDIRDKMPPRAFLPRDITSKIPFEVGTVSSLFGATQGTAMRKVVASTVDECARQPSRAETKRCTASAEDIVDFAVEMLGNNIVVRSTESTAGSGGNIRIGRATGVAGGNVTRAVSCHQSLFPYMVYYCHSVPRVRVYEADILAVDSDQKINHGVVICHLETSDWSPNHSAFIALGGKPGEIEVCHWIFEGDMTWTVAD